MACALPSCSIGMALWCVLCAALLLGVQFNALYATYRSEAAFAQTPRPLGNRGLGQNPNLRSNGTMMLTGANSYTGLLAVVDGRDNGGAMSVQTADDPSSAVGVGGWWRDLPHNTSRPMRVVFLGDSVTRYQYLDLAYRLHHSDDGQQQSNSKLGGAVQPPPAALLHNPRNNSWMSFFTASTGLFNGSMLCDCSRQPYGVRVDMDATLENRYYQHPRRPLHLAYLQLFGSQPMASRVPLRNTTGAVPRLVALSGGGSTDGTWHYHRKSLRWVVEHELAGLQPTHIVVNIGFWGHKKLINEIHTILRAMRRIAPHVVWRATSQPSPSCSLLRSKRAQAAWLNTQHKIQTLDVVVQRGGLCRPPTPSADIASTGAVLQSDASAGAGGAPAATTATRNRSTLEDVCTFFPLASPRLSKATKRQRIIPESEFVDEVHPMPYVYGTWNANLWPFLRSLHEKGSA